MQPLQLPGPVARSIIERDRKVISPSYPRGYPFVMDHGRGVEVWDVDGNRFLDFAAESRWFPRSQPSPGGQSHPGAGKKNLFIFPRIFIIRNGWNLGNTLTGLLLSRRMRSVL